MDTIIEITGLAHIIAAKDVDKIALFLEKAMAGQAPPPKNPQAYAWPNLIKRVDALLREAMSYSSVSRREGDLI